ncbi:magnesium and cobalt transport protein CorA [Brevibacterium aurantiacum]|uniref:Magnesium and cobalt transport protein CorA n=1 Tax=Brevibacterium aurantiacum TaxID=273384 RepID=A0A1D7W754_BREAU|nr:magnesium and cobalt transport protein CorA [Brevibacterium aurantiacum]AOP54795.1 Magnesium and cobalt transport protein CorA [Brevibacterium aurantiacum]RCS95743.1 magnesium and cobalt transport protein CorA [Brevibacterium aurantiacum]
MARARRHKTERAPRRKQSVPTNGTSPAAAPVVISRRIVDSVPQELTVTTTFAEALAAPADDSPTPTDDSPTGPAGSTPVTEATAASAEIHQIIVPRSTPALLEEISSAWELHPVLVDDLFHANQRPKVERYDDVLFVVLKSAIYIDSAEEVEFKEFHLLMKGDVLVIVCQDDRFIDGTPIPDRREDMDAYFTNEKRLWSSDRELLALGPEPLVYRLLDTAVDTYFPVLDGLQDDKDGIERQVFSGDTAAAERIYLLSQEVIDVLHTTTHLNRLTQRLGNGATKYAIPDELQAYLDDVTDHLTRVLAESAELREALSQILNVNSTLVAQRQNEDMKKISGWAAILFAPTLIGAIYGMNFDDMPELHWTFGYPMALGLMLGLGIVLYTVFKKKKWM